MTPAEINKTSAIAKVRILVEQVIKRLKTFQIIANEMSHANDILIASRALCNFKEPLYNDKLYLIKNFCESYLRQKTNFCHKISLDL